MTNRQNGRMKTNRLLTRPIQLDEYDALLRIYQVKKNMQYILDGKYAWTLESLKSKWRKTQYSDTQQTGFQIIVLKSNNRIIGECALLGNRETSNKTLELAYLIDHQYWGNGYGREIVQALFQHGFENLKVERLIAGMYKANWRSAKLVQKMGMQLSLEGRTKSGVEFQEYELLRHTYFDSKNQ